jgi:hypothetical protein
MKPPYAHVSQTALAALAAAVSIWLAVFFLPGSRVQPIPLLPALGSAISPATANVPTPAPKQLAKPQRPVVFAPVLARPAAPARTAVSRPLTVHRPHRAATASRPHRAAAVHRVDRPAPTSQPRHSAPAPVATAPAPVPAASAPATAPPRDKAKGWEPRHATPPPRGKAKGWERHHAQARVAATPAGGKAKALGHSRHHHRSLPPGQAKKAADAVTVAPAAAPAPQAPPKAHGRHDNGKHAGKAASGQPAPVQSAPGKQADHGNKGQGGGGKK